MKKTARELWQDYKMLLDKKGIFKLDGINTGSTKATIQNAIDCLKCSDETLDDYLTVVKLTLPNTYQTIVNVGNWKLHPFNRLYVYNTAKMYIK